MYPEMRIYLKDKIYDEWYTDHINPEGTDYIELNTKDALGYVIEENYIKYDFMSPNETITERIIPFNNILCIDKIWKDEEENEQ